MRKNIKAILIVAAVLLLSSCSVKQGQLQIIEKNSSNYSNASENLSLNFNIMPQKLSIEKNAELLKKVKPGMMPLAVSVDTEAVIGFQIIDSNETDEINSRVITGNMLQPINLYCIDVKNSKEYHIGSFLTTRDFEFDDSGKLFAFIDGNSNVYVYDVVENQLQKMIEGKSYNTYDSISWSKDSKKLLLNQKMTLDVSSKQLISYAVDAYSPYILQRYNNNDTYIVQMKNNEYNDMIALYNYDSRSFKSLASGIFYDSDNINLIYSSQNQDDLYLLNLETLESKIITSEPIYNAKIMRSTGEILYTTVNQDMNSQKRYQLVKLNPNSGNRKVIDLSTPTFYLSPAEDKIFFISNYNQNRVTVDTAGLSINQSGEKLDYEDLLNIKTVILKMLQLDYNFNKSYDEYEIQAKKIYMNTYDPIPQEALENKLLDFKRFNMPLPAGQKEPVFPSTVVLNSLVIQDNRASANIGLFYINSIELTKHEGNWFITGFSTHPDSKEVKDVRVIVQKHLNDILENNNEEALKYWLTEDNQESNEKQLQIVQDIMKEADSSKLEIGEIELWSINEPHRAESPQNAIEAKVKIIIKSENSTKKYRLLLSKYQKRGFSISSWSIDPLSISQIR